jgi:hypothetical protein
MGAYRKNHIATRAYLQGWTDPAGLLVRVSLKAGREEKQLPPGAVGVRSRFFRDPAVAASAEKTMNVYETRAISVLRRIDDLWPLSDSDRWALAGLLAVHIYRSPLGRGRINEISMTELERRKHEYRASMSPKQLEAFYGMVRHERFEVQYMLETIPKTAALIASAHWSLVKFPLPLLATSDQPITVVPLLDDGTAPLQTLPTTGLLGTEEFRFALGPESALICTWMDRPDGEPPIAGDEAMAAQLNRAVIGQADGEWFYRPGRRPTTITADNLRPVGCRPIGRLFLPGYGIAHVRRSRRRIETMRNAETMIETDTRGRVVIAKVQPADPS